MDLKNIEEIRLRHQSRMDEGWVTINGAHVFIDNEGNLSGKVGEKIAGSSKNSGSGIKAHGKWKATNFNDALKEMKEELPGRGRYDLETYI